MNLLWVTSDKFFLFRFGYGTCSVSKCVLKSNDMIALFWPFLLFVLLKLFDTKKDAINVARICRSFNMSTPIWDNFVHYGWCRYQNNTLESWSLTHDTDLNLSRGDLIACYAMSYYHIYEIVSFLNWCHANTTSTKLQPVNYRPEPSGWAQVRVERKA